jgi:hypothetical protein
MLGQAEGSKKIRWTIRRKLIAASSVAIVVIAAALFVFSGFSGAPKTGNTLVGAVNNGGNSAPISVGGTLVASYSPYVRGGTTFQWYVIATSNGNVAVIANYDTLTDAQILTLQQRGHGGGIIVQADPATMQIVNIIQ